MSETRNARAERDFAYAEELGADDDPDNRFARTFLDQTTDRKNKDWPDWASETGG